MKIDVTRIEVRPGVSWGVIFARHKGRPVYTMMDKDSCAFYALCLAEGRGVTLDVASWKVTPLEDVP